MNVMLSTVSSSLSSVLTVIPVVVFTTLRRWLMSGFDNLGGVHGHNVQQETDTIRGGYNYNSSLQQQKQQQQFRILVYEDDSDTDAGASVASSSSSSSLNNLHNDENVMIAWYCFIGVSAFVLCSMCCAVVWRIYDKRVVQPASRTRQQQQDTVRREALARIQANITKFTAQQHVQRTRDLCTLLQPQTMVLQANDPRILQKSMENRLSSCEEEDTRDIEEGSGGGSREGSGDDDNHDDDVDDTINKDVSLSWENQFPATKTGDSYASQCCFICLEDFQQGEIVCQAATGNYCQHTFHQECIISWLINHHHRSDCPVCRQEFLPTTSPTTTTTMTASNNILLSVTAEGDGSNDNTDIVVQNQRHDTSDIDSEV